MSVIWDVDTFRFCVSVSVVSNFQIQAFIKHLLIHHIYPLISVWSVTFYSFLTVWLNNSTLNALSHVFNLISNRPQAHTGDQERRGRSHLYLMLQSTHIWPLKKWLIHVICCKLLHRVPLRLKVRCRHTLTRCRRGGCWAERATANEKIQEEVLFLAVYVIFQFTQRSA